MSKLRYKIGDKVRTKKCLQVGIITKILKPKKQKRYEVLLSNEKISCVFVEEDLELIDF